MPKLLRRPGLYVDALFLALAFTLGAGLVPMLALAQPAEAPPAPLSPQSTVPVNELVTAGTALGAWALTELGKRFLPKLPRMAVLALPLVLSGIITAVGAWLHATPVGSWQNVVATILAGALAVYGNEVKTTNRDWGLTGKG